MLNEISWWFINPVDALDSNPHCLVMINAIVEDPL